MENPTNQEHLPSPEEIVEIFKRLLEGKNFTDVRKLEDEKGIYLWEIKVSSNDENTEYSYRRKGTYKETRSASTVIDVTFFDREGIPIGGHSVADLTESGWSIHP
jgi:hypothetical protein